MHKFTDALAHLDLVWVKDYQPWGYCPTYKDSASGEVFFQVSENLLTQKELEDYIKNDWQPKTEQENQWKWRVTSGEIDFAEAKASAPIRSEEEVRKQVISILRSNIEIVAQLSNPMTDDMERSQLTEKLTQNTATLRGHKWALGE